MIKKITAYSFILLANIVLLAHAVLPHHHHEKQVYIKQIHGIDGASTHNHSVPEHNHQHDGTDHIACLLEQAVTIPSLHSRITNNCDNCSDSHNHDVFIVSHTGYEDLQPVSAPLRFLSEFYSSSYITFVTTSLGLRAPPIV